MIENFNGFQNFAGDVTRMNVVHLCLANHYSDGFGYQENLLTKYHKKMGLKVTIITSQWTFDNNGELVKTDKSDYENEDGIRIIRLPIKNGTSETRIKRYDNLISVLESVKPDIIFIHCPQFLNMLTIGNYLKYHPKTRAYVDNHSDYSNSATSWLSKNVQHRIVWHFCVNRVKKYIRKFYGVLPARVDFMKELYGLKDLECELLVMGADDELVFSAENDVNIDKLRNKHGISAGDFLIVTGGKIDAYKNQTILLMEAVKRLKKDEVKLIVFGSIDKNLQNKVNELTDENKVQYIGWINTNDSYSYFAAADLVVFPGRHSVFWEQVVAQGKPMVVKDWEGTHHIDIGGNVIYLKHDSTDEIEEVLRSLVEPDSKRYEDLKRCAESEKKKQFLYSIIAKKSIEMENT